MLKEPKNNNYAAVVIEVKATVALAGCDNIVGLPIYGYQAITSKDTKPGDIGVMFPPEAQVSDSFANANNLFRDKTLNFDKEKKGYLETNARIRAIKLRGHRSDALFLPLSTLAFTGHDISTLKPGDMFDELNGVEICRKYVIKRQYSKRQGQHAFSKRESRVEKRYMPEHTDSGNFFRVRERLDPNAFVVITQKLHGTSVRVANTIVRRKLSHRDRIAKWFGVAVQDVEFGNVYGSRRVIKDANNPEMVHFYSSDIWTSEGRKLDGLLPKNYIVYGEIVGWDGEKPIQEDYTYNCLPGSRDLYVYRVAVVNQDGVVTDLSWDALKGFCALTGIKHVPELWRGKLSDFEPVQFLDVAFSVKFDNAVLLSPESPCDEGVCVRIEDVTPKIYKAKSPVFLAHETEQADLGNSDVESMQDAPAEEGSASE